MQAPLRLVALVVLGGFCAPVTAAVGAQAAAETRPADSTRFVSAMADTSRGPADTSITSSRAVSIAPDAASSSDEVTPPPIDRLRAGVHARETARPLALADEPLAAPSNGGLGQARAMMVVGVAALVAGAVIGGTPGTIIMVGGAVIGLVGLYNYLQ